MPGTTADASPDEHARQFAGAALGAGGAALDGRDRSVSPLTRRDRVGIALSGVIVALGSVALAGSGAFGYDANPSGQVDMSSPPTAVDDITTGLTRWQPGRREKAPVLRGRTLDAGRLSTAAYRGQVVVVNAWGSWCALCRDEAPDLGRAARETRHLGVRFLGIDTRDNGAAANAFVRQFRLPYPSLVDDDGRLLLALRDTVPAQAIPSTMLLDRQGRIAARIVGRVPYSTLRGLIDDLVAEPRSR